MKPYLTAISPRPGCQCCVTQHGHSIKNRYQSQTKTVAKRAGKKSMRQALKRELSVY